MNGALLVLVSAVLAALWIDLMVAMIVMLDYLGAS